MIVKIHNSYRNVVCICDTELLGKKFEEGDRILDIRESFYKGDEISPDKVEEIIIDMAKEDATFNIVGKESTELAIKTGIISKDAIGQVQDTPFALVLL